MGIKGIYRELGPGQRISLAKLATEHLEKTGRPLRLAVDIAIWQFQTQAAKGGSNPAIRTLFYRLVRLLSHAIQPVFVFDGPDKPRFKRNKSAGRGDGVASAMAKRLIRLFGLPVHEAPGEAEAECALLQQQGIVDAVMSEDVDALMFGCSRTLRAWTSEGSRGSKTPTHVTVYDVSSRDGITASPGLDREGMVLVAMMSGGDYIPEGVPGCGVKLACEIARAGFGKTLCRLRRNAPKEWDAWRASLKHELATNESKFFRTRHKALTIPDNFPDMQVLRYYTHPVVSPEKVIQDLELTFQQNTAVDIVALREFVGDTFDWTYRPGAIKLIRVLSPSLLVQMLLRLSTAGTHNNDPSGFEKQRHALAMAILGKRAHFSVDGLPELKISHVPSSVVPIDLTKEVEETIHSVRDGLALNSDDEFDCVDTQGNDENLNGRSKKIFDPSIAQPVWVPESLVKLSLPSTVQDWEQAQQTKITVRKEKKMTGKTKTTDRKKTTIRASNSGPGVPPMDRWLRTVKIQHTMEDYPLSVAPKLQIPEPIPSPILPKSNDRGPPQVMSSTGQRRTLHTTATCSRSKPRPTAGAVPAAMRPDGADIWASTGSQTPPRVNRPKRNPAPSTRPSCLDHNRTSSPPSPPLSPSSVSSKHSPTFISDAQPALRVSLSSSNDTTTTMRPTSSCCPSASPQASPSKRSQQEILRQTKITSFIEARDSALPTADQDVVIMSQAAPSHGDIILAKEASTQSRRKEAVLVDNHDNSVERYTGTGNSSSRRENPRGSPAIPSHRTKVYVPRLSAAGFIKEVEISQEEADELLDESAQPHRRLGKIWRQSAVSVIDLTDDA